MANPGDAFPAAVQEAHEAHQLSEQQRLADEQLLLKLKADAAAARSRRSADDNDDDVDDKVGSRAKLRQLAASKRRRRGADHSDDDANDKIDRVVDDNDDNEDEEDDDEEEDDDDDDDDDEGVVPSFYLGMQLAQPSFTRLVCYPSTLRDLRAAHPHAQLSEKRERKDEQRASQAQHRPEQ